MGFADHAWILAQNFSQQVIPILRKGRMPQRFMRFRKYSCWKSLFSPEVVVGHLSLFGEPIPTVLFRTVIPAVRKIPGAEFILSD